jgi:DNA-binding response OmpR family regulator
MTSARSTAVPTLSAAVRPARRERLSGGESAAAGDHLAWSPPGNPGECGTLLVIDPDPERRAAFDDFGPAWNVSTCATAAEGLLLAGGLRPDVVFLSAQISDLPAATVVELLDRCCGVPAVVATDAEHADQAAAALEAGAVACVSRHYRSEQLHGVLTAARPTRRGADETVLRAGTLELAPAAGTVRLRGSLVVMPPREFRVLEHLMRNEGSVVSQAQLWSAVWGRSGPSASNTVSVHVRRLRRRLGDDLHEPHIITTVGRSGYLFQAVPG